jgi:hypothetical protein
VTFDSVPRVSTHPGLCASCLNSRLVAGANSRFWLCELSRTDPRFPRYPRLPVLRCDGYQPTVEHLQPETP